ncbi:hypothetical protein RSSM_02239 [Rhodopirellula sallentina SM41]|uniref:Uncharacterized protein n=1 Tax=Rhodopirellula sallentina SM41 TaxID=1263870 RepID=M5UEP8_9BACT|nr:hypothetical protein RSSM_02239 [Rhodopirellula sallentina SM41]
MITTDIGSPRRWTPVNEAAPDTESHAESNCCEGGRVHLSQEGSILLPTRIVDTASR